MAIYRYQSGSLVDSVQILTNENGGLRAFLSAHDNAPNNAALRDGKQALRNLGLKCVPIVHDGKPALEVRGFKKQEELIAALKTAGLATTNHTLTAEASDTRSGKEKLAKSTLKTAGGLYIAGDLMFFWSKGGPLAKMWKTASKSDRLFGIMDLVAGVGYFLGSITLALFGSRDQSLNTIEGATKKIERYARKEGLPIAPEASIAFANEAPDIGIVKKTSRILDKYPSEVFNSIYILVGSALASAALYRGLKPLEKGLVGEALKVAKGHQKTELVDVGLGAITATSGLIGIAVKETKPLPSDPKPKGIIGTVVNGVREKPLRATGFGYLIATGVHSFTTFRHWKGGQEDKKFLIGRVGFIAMNIVAELLLMISSKGHGTGVKPDSSVDKSVIATTAELIFRQPPEQHEKLIHQFAGYMASHDVLGENADKIATELRTHLEALDDNPWTKHYVEPKAGAVHAEEPVHTPAHAHVHTATVPGTKINQAEYIAPQQATAHHLATARV